MLRRLARHLMLLLVVGLGVAGCAVLDSGQATPGPAESPLSSPPQGIPLAGVAPLVSPLPVPPPSAPTAGAAQPVSPLPPPRAVSPLALPPVGAGQPVSPLPSPRPAGKVAVGAAPDFSLQRENGQTLRLSDARGKNVVLVFYRGQT